MDSDLGEIILGSLGQLECLDTEMASGEDSVCDNNPWAYACSSEHGKRIGVHAWSVFVVMMVFVLSVQRIAKWRDLRSCQVRSEEHHACYWLRKQHLHAEAKLPRSVNTATVEPPGTVSQLYRGSPVFHL